MLWQSAGETSRLPVISMAFVLVAAFSLSPQILAWSTLWTSADVICYMYVGMAFLLAVVVRYVLARVQFRHAAH